MSGTIRARTAAWLNTPLCPLMGRVQDHAHSPHNFLSVRQRPCLGVAAPPVGPEPAELGADIVPS
eukprot:7396139-Pyramimonas_sp.AAC.2